MNPLLNFGEALQHLKLGRKVARAGWNGKGQWIALQLPDANSMMTLPYLYIKPVSKDGEPGNFVPWLASQTDILAEDWDIVGA